MNGRRLYDTPASSDIPAIDDVDMMDPARKDDAVSEIIGAVLLISIVVIAVSIVGVILWSQPPPQKIPSLSVSISNSSCNVTLIHGGGDTVENTYIALLVDGIDQTGTFIKQSTGAPWTSWGNGETIVYSPSYTCLWTPQRVDIIYYAGTSRTILTSGYFGDLFSTGGAARPPSAPVSPDFTGTPLAGFVPFDVQFTGTSTGSPITWLWDFGDGGTSTLQNPSHTYTSVQFYTVSLTVNNGSGTSTKTKTNYIAGYRPLIAEFTSDTTTGSRPLPVQFTDQSLGSPVSWSWVFGDGGTSTAQSPPYTYLRHGRYTVSQTVTNASAGTNSTTKINYITVTPNPVWYSCSWGYRKNITIDKAKVPSDQTNFPVLINLTSDNDLKISARSDGFDILFTSSDGVTKLPHEIEKYNNGNGALLAWVNVPSVTSAANTTIYMYYGYPASINQQLPTSVWDTNYRGVWHLKENPAGAAPQMLDSTSNARHGTSAGAMTLSDQVEAMINGGLNFDGSNDEITAPMDVITAEITVEAWARVTGTGTMRGIVNKMVSTYAGYTLLRHSTNRFSFATGNPGTATQYARSDSTYTDTNWHHIVGVRRAGTNYLYVDGVQQTQTFVRVITDSGSNFDIGRMRSNSNANWWNRDIDEVRVSNIGRTASWIATEYNNINSPSTFHYIMGQEQWMC